MSWSAFGRRLQPLTKRFKQAVVGELQNIKMATGVRAASRADKLGAASSAYFATGGCASSLSPCVTPFLSRHNLLKKGLPSAWVESARGRHHLPAHVGCSKQFVSLGTSNTWNHSFQTISIGHYNHRRGIRTSLRCQCAPENAAAKPASKKDDEKVSDKKLAAFREQLTKAGVDAYIIPSEDPHQSEYSAECFNRRTYISGFTGSAGTAVVTKEKAALWTDGRYFLQVRVLALLGPVFHDSNFLKWFESCLL